MPRRRPTTPARSGREWAEMLLDGIESLDSRKTQQAYTALFGTPKRKAPKKGK